MKREAVCQIFSHMPAIRTERLLLRPMHVTDAMDMFEYASREEVTTFLLWSPHRTISYTRDYLRYIEDRYALGDFYDWAITLADSGKMIGTCGFTRLDLPHNSGEIGYVLSPDFHNLGYATEAASAVLKFGFEELCLNRLEARFMQGNDASLRVMEKLGMTFEGFHRDAMLVKGSYRTIGVAAILKDEFNAKKNV
ncbi:MAG: GNAT family N-acetyltransferase [Clostridia bacterium]|nr:GNAT family N-acetyltransferase [Clostridia bacterium]